jgi:hypothetical protein
MYYPLTGDLYDKYFYASPFPNNARKNEIAYIEDHTSSQFSRLPTSGGDRRVVLLGGLTCRPAGASFAIPESAGSGQEMLRRLAEQICGKVPSQRTVISYA